MDFNKILYTALP